MGPPLNGYIKLYRQMLDWGWYDDTNTKVVFLHLLLTANFKDTEWHGIQLKRGDVVTSIPSLAAALKLSERNVRTAISHLKATGEVTDKTFSKFRIISIKNYSQYQDDDRQSDRQTSGNRQSDDSQATGNRPQRKNDKNERIKEGKNKALSSDFTEETASFDFDSVVELFHSLCPSLAKVSRLTKKQKNDILKANTVLNGDFTSLFNRVEKSDFLKGVKGNWNGATFGWIFVPENLEKIISGRYDNKESSNTETKPDYDEEF